MLLKPFLASEAVADAVETAAESGFAFHPEMFVENLKYMGLGMLCIFIVIAVIIGIVMLLEKVTSRKQSDAE